jgi:4-hydroxy-tetrahydrodipicolinate synthase
MSAADLRGIVAAVATPISATLEPDLERFLRLAQDLLDHGCDALNVLGTTGEATSLSRDQRVAVMRVAASSLDRRRLMVGTGAASLADAIHLTRMAGSLGFAGALVLPPFYYKGVSETGVFTYMAEIVAASEADCVPLYLYHFPALSGVPFTETLVTRLCDAFPGRIRGLKDSSGDLAYATAVAKAHPNLAVFPSNEATLPGAAEGLFAGCISATCNLNAALCAQALHRGDAAALQKAVEIRRLFDGKPLVAGVKAGLAALHGDAELARLLPPLEAWDKAAAAGLGADLARLGAIGSQGRR